MDAVAKSTSTVFQEIGTVNAVVGDKLGVHTASGAFAARVAASCLLRPRPGDSVLVAVPPDGDLFVLAVLERDDAEGAHELRVEGDLELKATGQLEICGLEGTQVRSPAHLELGAPQISVTGVETRVSSDRLHVFGRVLQAHADTVKTVLGAIDSFADRVSQHVKRSYRFVEEMDVTRAKQIDSRAERTMTLRAKNTFVAAEDLVKVDGDQIHLG